MSCERHDALLEKYWENVLEPEEAALLQAHEKTCPACTARRRRMDAFRTDLSALKEEELPLPKGFTQRWTRLVKEEAVSMQENEAKKTLDASADDIREGIAENTAAKENARTAKFRRVPRRAMRVFAAAAAVLFVVVGTFATRGRLSDETDGTVSAASNDTHRTSRSSVTYGTTSSSESWEEYASADMAVGSSMSTADSGSGETEAAVMLIRNVSLTLGTDSFDEDLAQLKTLCTAQGGRVSYSSVSGDAEEHSRYASLTLRIPAEKLDAFLEGAESLGRVISQSESTEDVTESYQDVQSRLDTQKSKMERLQVIMSETATLSELLELESAIADTQYEIDSLQRQLDRTEDQVAYSTVDIYLNEESDAVVVTVQEKALGERLLTALRLGWSSFWSFLKDMLVFASAVLPYAMCVVILCVVIAALRRRRKRKNGGER